MKGVVKGLVTNRNFGFIRAGNVEYFFHRDDFNGHWNDLVNDMNNHMQIPVEFEDVPSPKGARAKLVKRLDYPNAT